MRTLHNRQSRSLQTLANFRNSFAGNNLPILRALLDAGTNMYSIRLQADNTFQLFFDTLLVFKVTVTAAVAAPISLQLQRFFAISGESAGFLLNAFKQAAPVQTLLEPKQRKITMRFIHASQSPY